MGPRSTRGSATRSGALLRPLWERCRDLRPVWAQVPEADADTAGTYTVVTMPSPRLLIFAAIAFFGISYLVLFTRPAADKVEERTAALVDTEPLTVTSISTPTSYPAPMPTAQAAPATAPAPSTAPPAASALQPAPDRAVDLANAFAHEVAEAWRAQPDLLPTSLRLGLNSRHCVDREGLELCLQKDRSTGDWGVVASEPGVWNLTAAIRPDAPAEILLEPEDAEADDAATE